MALFDDNYGKDLSNATIWLESSNDSGDGGGPDNPGCGFRILICALGAIVIICNILFTCTATT